MKCPKCKKDMFLGWLEPDDHEPLAAWICPTCPNEYYAPTKEYTERTYNCAFCGKPYKHVQTDDHTPLAELIDPECAKKMGLELQTHPPNSENDKDTFSGC